MSATQAGGPECGSPAPIKRKDRLIPGAHWPSNELMWWALESVGDHGSKTTCAGAGELTPQ